MARRAHHGAVEIRTRIRPKRGRGLTRDLRLSVQPGPRFLPSTVEDKRFRAPAPGRPLSRLAHLSTVLAWI